MQERDMKEEDITVDVIDDVKEDSVSSQRIPKCARCRCHGINNELKGHKEKCQFKDCECRLCLMVVERQKITAIRVAHLRHQRKVDKQRANRYYSAYPPLTEEEDYVLSNYMDGESARRHRIYIQDRYRYINGRPYSAPTIRSGHYEQPHSAYGHYSDSYNSRIATYDRRQNAPICTQSCCRDDIEHKVQTGGYDENEARRQTHPYSRTLIDDRVKDEKVDTEAEKSNHDSKQEFNDNNNSEERNITSKEVQRRDEFIRAKCWEVLSVMFPDFDVKLIKYASDKARYNIQLAVEYLLEMKKQLREEDDRGSAFAKYKSRDQPMKTCPCCYKQPASNTMVRTVRTKNFEENRPRSDFYEKTES